MKILIACEFSGVMRKDFRVGCNSHYNFKKGVNHG